MKLHEIETELKKLCPDIIGICSNGRIDFGDVATAQQKASATEKMKELLPLYNSFDYRDKRLLEYPAIGDQLDAIMKWLATETEISIPSELKSLAAKCMSVKSKYPKS